MTDMYHAGNRELQDRFDTRRLADRLEEVKVHDRFTPDDREFVERLDMFFLASADEHGNPTCSYKGGDPGFVRVVDDRTLAFPNYDGNGMYLSMGNVAVNPSVGLLFIDFERQRRMRVDGYSEDAVGATPYSSAPSAEPPRPPRLNAGRSVATMPVARSAARQLPTVTRNTRFLFLGRQRFSIEGRRERKMSQIRQVKRGRSTLPDSDYRLGGASAKSGALPGETGPPA